MPSRISGACELTRMIDDAAAQVRTILVSLAEIETKGTLLVLSRVPPASNFSLTTSVELMKRPDIKFRVLSVVSQTLCKIEDAGKTFIFTTGPGLRYHGKSKDLP